MRFFLALLTTALLATGGCQRAYYGALESAGIHKRDVLVSRVEKARDSQEDAKEQFRDALEAFRATVDVDGGDLEDLYDDLNGEFERSEARAEAVRERIDNVEDVAEALFREWEDELEEISNASLRSKSQRQLADTRDSYSGLIRAMRRAEATMDPVLVKFRDQVLYLKHNLNARAVAALDGELAGIEDDVERLVRDMERAIGEASAFIEAMDDE